MSRSMQDKVMHEFSRMITEGYPQYNLEMVIEKVYSNVLIIRIQKVTSFDTILRLRVQFNDYDMNVQIDKVIPSPVTPANASITYDAPNAILNFFDAFDEILCDSVDTYFNRKRVK